DIACFARLPLQLAGDSRNIRDINLNFELRTMNLEEEPSLNLHLLISEFKTSKFQNPHRSSTDPTVNPAPTDASRTRFPFFSRPLQTASFNASGIVAAVVLPNRSMLMMTLAGSRPSFSVAD